MDIWPQPASYSQYLWDPVGRKSKHMGTEVYSGLMKNQIKYVVWYLSARWPGCAGSTWRWCPLTRPPTRGWPWPHLSTQGASAEYITYDRWQVVPDPWPGTRWFTGRDSCPRPGAARTCRPNPTCREIPRSEINQFCWSPVFFIFTASCLTLLWRSKPCQLLF